MLLTGEGQSDWLHGCSFHPDGAKLATTGGDTMVSLSLLGYTNTLSIRLRFLHLSVILIFLLSWFALPAGASLGFFLWFLCVDPVRSQPAHLGLLISLMWSFSGFLLCGQNCQTVGLEQPALPPHTAPPHCLCQQCLLPALLQPPPHMLS